MISVSVATSGHEISIVLWGERAIAFEGDWVLETSKKNPVIAIFVGTLVKTYEGLCISSCFSYLLNLLCFYKCNIIVLSSLIGKRGDRKSVV